jgi:endogenous inhibitor of DNA gyrase (YacG/DUF329 family)
MIRPLECPICRKSVLSPLEASPSFFPFCGERCRQVDLLRWAQGKYAIVEPLGPDQLPLGPEPTEGDDDPGPHD